MNRLVMGALALLVFTVDAAPATDRVVHNISRPVTWSHTVRAGAGSARERGTPPADGVAAAPGIWGRPGPE